MNIRTLYIPKTLKITQEQFEQLARENRDRHLEKSATGELIIMPPTGGNTGRRNIEIEGQQLFICQMVPTFLLMLLGLVNTDGIH